MNCIHKNIRILLLMSGVCCAMGSHAATQTADMDVTATIVASCTLRAAKLNFGIVVPWEKKNTGAVVTATCTSGTSYALDVGNGEQSTTTGGTGNQFRRQMVSGANFLPYVLYHEAERVTEIGVSGNDNFLTNGVGNGEEQHKTIYGSVIGAEIKNNPAGDYSDKVVVTITF